MSRAKEVLQTIIESWHQMTNTVNFCWFCGGRTNHKAEKFILYGVKLTCHKSCRARHGIETTAQMTDKVPLPYDSNDPDLK